MGKLKNSDIYRSNIPGGGTALSAISDILSQRIPARLGLKLRKIKRVIDAQVADVQAEVDRILEQYPEDEDGKRNDEAIKAINDEVAELMEIEFECELIKVSALDGLSLQGWTFASPLIEDDTDDSSN